MKSPKLADAHRLIKSHSYQWNELGLSLEVPYNYRTELKSMNVSNNVRLEGVLNKWIETESVPVTWDRLIKGLEEIQLRVVIRSVKEFLKTDQALATYTTSVKGNGLIIIKCLDVKTNVSMIIINDVILCIGQPQTTHGSSRHDNQQSGSKCLFL